MLYWTCNAGPTRGRRLTTPCAVESSTLGGSARTAVLFDLDGTLLDIDGEAFLDAYVDALTAWWQPPQPDRFRQQIMAASVPIFAHHPDATNGDIFRRHLGDLLALSPGAVADRIHHFHREQLGALRFPAQPRPEARATVRRCQALGLRVAVATTPIYLPEVIWLRLGWAGLDDIPWDLVTHSEVMHTCKPAVAYYHEVAHLVGVPPAACCMVGDDPLQDGPAERAGMALLLRDAPGAAGWRQLDDVTAVLAGAAPGAPPPP